jgi:hypothetical protein
MACVEPLLNECLKAWYFMLKTPPTSCPTPELRRFEQLLASGGDERIAIDPGTGRNRYGLPRGKACDEAWFSSSTATAISPRGYDAALQAYRSIIATGDARAISAWFESLRARLTRLFGIKGSDIVFAASGTELELVALGLARGILRPPLLNLVVAPAETGRGVLLAASGRHFLGSAPFCEDVACGAWLEGFEAPETFTATVEIRDEAGMPLSADSIDSDVVQKVEAAIAGDRCVLIHLLDCSKTNRGGPRRSTASALMARYAGQVLVVVDSCQLRCTPEQIMADLRDGFMVMISGSKFAAGPPFAGALLLPPGMVDQVRDLDLPPGLLAYTAAEDWPVALRGQGWPQFAAAGNVGAGLRWEAALAELEKLFALPIAFRDAVAEAFADAVEALVLDNPALALVDHTTADGLRPLRTIFSIVTRAPERMSAASEAVYRALMLPRPDDPLSGAAKRIFHVGQPVAIGPRSALRVCLSASHIVEVAETMAKDGTFETAVAPLLADIDGLFLKWARVASGLRGCG